MSDYSLDVSQHDKFQLELKFVCPFDNTKKINESNFEIFFFLPQNLRINPGSYNDGDFYRDFTEYNRFKTPERSLKELDLPSHPLYRQISAAVRKLPASRSIFSRQLKMFCSIAKSSMRDSKRALELLPQEERSQKIGEYITSVEKLLENYRQLKRPDPKFAEERELFSLVDEYLSITANGYLFRFWEFIQQNPDQTHPENAERIAELTGKEIAYRQKQHFPSAEADYAELLYRESTLKKAMASVLFLEISQRKDGIFLENLLLGLSAAIAMIFVTAISFLWKWLFLEELSLSFFVVWVIAYMFKDRIKSLLQTLCMHSRSRYSYDYRKKVRDGFNRNLGIMQEGFRFCQAENLPDIIRQMRDRTSLSVLENGILDENVILFRKRFELRGSAIKGMVRKFHIHGIVSLFRLNIRRWTLHMDNPVKRIYTSDGKTISPAEAQRDYHVNMVVCYGPQDGMQHYARYRLVLCRDGIRRIEHREQWEKSLLP